MKLNDLIKFLKGAGRDVKLRIDKANPDLIAEALARGCSHTSWEDCQIIGRFHHYTVREGNVEVELITTRPVSKEEAQAAAYQGYTLSQYRALKRNSDG